MSKPKKKYTKIGKIIDGEYGKFIALGDEKNQNPDYNTTVQIRVTSKAGGEVKIKNGTLSIMDPRNRPGITEEQAAKIPEKIVSEIFIVTEE